jgi:hypothetical protein
MGTRRRSAVLIGTGLLAVMLTGAAACDRTGAGGDAGPTTAANSSAVAVPTPVPATAVATTAVSPPAVRTTAAGAPTPAPAGVTLRGTLAEGVEGTCLILQADNGYGYQLIGLPKHLAKPGYRLEVRGHKAVGQQSICMQGILFKVTSARRI